MALWTPATVLVLSSVLAIAALMGVVSVRLGRMAPRSPGVEPPQPRAHAHADGAMSEVGRRRREAVGAARA